MRAILLTALVGPLNEAQDARLGEILRGTRPRAVEPGEFPYELFSDQKTKGRLKSLVEAEVATDFPSLHTLLLCLGDWIFDSR